MIVNIQKFTELVLPKFYKHQNYASFVRQLNLYGFFKVSPDSHIYKNENFIRGKLNLLKFIERRQIGVKDESEEISKN